MPRRDTPPQGAPCWIDLSTSDVDRSRAFYTELLGWTAEEPNTEFGGYFNFRKDGVRVAGCIAKEAGSTTPDGWTVHLAAGDARAAVDEAVANGARQIVAPMAVADLGVTALVIDPGGAPVGIWQPGTHPGSGIVYEPGVPTWYELHTTDYPRSLDFYKRIFGWTTQTMGDAPDFRYTMVIDGEQRLAGVMDDSVFAPAGTPAYWLVYFGFSDADAGVARVRELGGTITREAEDTPYGRLASVKDPTGAAFNIMGPNAAMPFTSDAAQREAVH